FPAPGSENTTILDNGLVGYVVPGGNSGTVSVTGYSNSTGATIRYNFDGHGDTVNTLLTQFHVTLPNGQAAQSFCIDLFHFVTAGQTYAVNERADLGAVYTNASQMAYIYQKYGMADLTNDPDLAAAVQIDLWDLLPNRAITDITMDNTGVIS